MFACIHSPDIHLLKSVPQDFSPVVEETSAGIMIFPVTGLSYWYQTLEQIAKAIHERVKQIGVSANIALSANIEVAVSAARGRPGITVIHRGQEEEALAPIPLEIICEPGDPARTRELLMTLDSWGVRTCREMAALPPLGVLERLGEQGLRLQQLARGIANRPLRPTRALVEYKEEAELEHPLSLLEPLSFVLADQLNRLCTKLESHCMATNQIELLLSLEDRSEYARTFRLPVPMRDARAFLKLLQLDLDSHPPNAPVCSVSLRMMPAAPRVLQNGLFIPLAPEPEKLEITLARIARIVGEQKVGSPRLVNTHRPGAFFLDRLGVRNSTAPAGSIWPVLSIRMFRPPLAAQVELSESKPLRIRARGIQGNVVSYAGPWRSCGDWWASTQWDRDEWDVALSDGALYRLCAARQGWYLEGVYD